MPQYLISYIGGDQSAGPEESRQHFTRYMHWLSALGDAAISPANPLKEPAQEHAQDSPRRQHRQRRDNHDVGFYDCHVGIDGSCAHPCP